MNSRKIYWFKIWWLSKLFLKKR